MTEDLRSKFDQAMTNVMHARSRLLEAKDAVIEGKEELKEQETANILDGSYTASGKNEKERESWLRAQTTIRRVHVLELEKSERVAVLNLEIALDSRRNLESILKIMELEA